MPRTAAAAATRFVPPSTPATAQRALRSWRPCRIPTPPRPAGQPQGRDDDRDLDRRARLVGLQCKGIEAGGLINCAAAIRARPGHRRADGVEGERGESLRSAVLDARAWAGRTWSRRPSSSLIGDFAAVNGVRLGIDGPAALPRSTVQVGALEGRARRDRGTDRRSVQGLTLLRQMDRAGRCRHARKVRCKELQCTSPHAD